MGITSTLSKGITAITNVMDNGSTNVQTSKGPNSDDIQSFNNAINTMVNTDWTLTDEFNFIYHNTLIPIEKMNIVLARNGLGAGTTQDAINASIMSVSVPELTSAEIENVSGGERRSGVKMHEFFRFEVKFRDQDALKMRRYFEKIWMAQQYEYFNDIKSSVTVTHKGIQIFWTDTALITGVSAVEFNNDTTAIGEFTLQFVSRTYNDNDIKGFGESNYVDKFVPANQKANRQGSKGPDYKYSKDNWGL